MTHTPDPHARLRAKAEQVAKGGDDVPTRDQIIAAAILDALDADEPGDSTPLDLVRALAGLPPR